MNLAGPLPIACLGSVLVFVVSTGTSFSFSKQVGKETAANAPPAWMQDLVIYEIAPKAFSSPNGPESGTFEGIKSRLPYLQELGVTGIWLAGYSRSDSHHFFNIWMGYATIEPDKLDPTLGTPDQFKAMIDGAHRRGIKIFLDVTTHGLMPGSPMVQRHGEWFRGGTWGMVDYDWNGGHTDLDNWWVQVWTNYVTQYGVDGFRLDVDIFRPDLWARIRKNATAAGHPVVIFEEANAVIPGVTDFEENDNRISDLSSAEGLNPVLAHDIPNFYNHRFGRSGTYKVEIQYADGSRAEGNTKGEGTLSVRLDGRTADKASRRAGDRTMGDGIEDVQLTIGNVADGPPRNIIAADDIGNRWGFPGGTDLKDLPEMPWQELGVPDNAAPWSGGILRMEGKAPVIRLYVPTLGYGSSILLSEHGTASHVARGSRAIFGYSFLFTPMIPLFMAGEEFDATPHNIPWQSSEFLSGRSSTFTRGGATMLYGSTLDWDELDQPHHHSMFEDVKRMLAIRRQERTLLRPLVRGDVEPKLVAVPYTSDIDVPVPYMRWAQGAGIVIMANRDTEKEANLRLKIPLDHLGRSPNGKYIVMDLWNGSPPRVYTDDELERFVCHVARDKTPGGGIGVVKVEWTR